MSYIGNLQTHRGLIGKIGEDIASDYLISIGHLILDRNYRIKYGEIDIISQKERTIHFIEVKTTMSSKTTPEEHIDRKKIIKMKNLAELYFNNYINLKKNLNNNTNIKSTLSEKDFSISLDFIGIVLNDSKSKKSINYIEGLEV